MEVLNDLVGYKNLKIYQNSDWFTFSLDSVLLANFVTINPKTKKILDLGCGNAPIPLILSTKTKASIVGVEIQKDSYDLATKSVLYNHLENQIQLYNIDMKKLKDIYESDSFDVIVCNPPYFKYRENSYLNDDIHKIIARHEKMIELDDILSLVKYLLKNNGVFAMVHRTERLIEIIEKFKKYGIEIKKIQFIYPKENSESNLMLIEGRKMGNSSLKMLPPLYIHKQNGDYTDEVLKMFE